MAIDKYTDKFGRKLFEVKVSLRSKKDATLRFRERKKGIKTLRKAELMEKRLREKAVSWIALKELEEAHWERLIDQWELALRKGEGSKRGLSKQTASEYISILRKYTQEWLKTPADQINRSMVKNLLECVSDKLSHSRTKFLKTAIDGIFTWAMDSGRIKNIHVSPARGITPHKRVEEKRPEILTLNEIKVFLKSAKSLNHKWYPIWVMACMTGMRSGELYALKWSDIDWENKRISVHKSYSSKTKSIGPTKGGYWRDIPISNTLESFLMDLQTARGTSEYILPHFGDWQSGNGAMILRKFLKGVGLPSIRFHALRSCFATQLIRDGVAPAVVMKICGWKDLKTMQRYIRLAGIEIEGATDNLKILPEKDVMGRVVELFDLKSSI